MTTSESESRERPEDPRAPDADLDLGAWRRIWAEDRQSGLSSHRKFIGGLIVAVKKLLRIVVRRPVEDLWERQRAYNLKLQAHVEGVAPHFDQLETRVQALGADLQQVQSELVRDLRLAREAQVRDNQELHDSLYDNLMAYLQRHWDFLNSHDERLTVVEGLHNEGWEEVADQTVALFSRVDQKLDRYRRASGERWDRLGALLAVAQAGGPPALAAAVEEEKYVEFEGLFRGVETDIEARLEPYLGILEDRSPVLDLGCGRGEALEALSAKGIECRGVDVSAEMVERCRAKGLTAEVSDLFQALTVVPAGSLGGVVSFHVIEHLPASDLDRLVRLAWHALRPGGVLIFETPSPLSLVVGARNFWLDPTHLRPIHPDSLRVVFELNGFDPVERLDLQPFPAAERLLEIRRDDLAPESQVVADRINALRDQLDRLLFGFQDFGLVGYKPS